MNYCWLHGHGLCQGCPPPIPGRDFTPDKGEDE
jgi:hypothetical protein